MVKIGGYFRKCMPSDKRQPRTQGCKRAGLSSQIFVHSKKKWEYGILCKSFYLLNISPKFLTSPSPPIRSSNKQTKKVNYFRPLNFLFAVRVKEWKEKCITWELGSSAKYTANCSARHSTWLGAHA